MDYPISVPSIGLVGGKFVDEDPLAGTPGSLIPAQWGNAVTDEIRNVIIAAGMVPNELVNTQLAAAIQQAIAKRAAVVGSARNVRMSVAAPSATATLTADEVFVKSGLGSSAWLIPSFNKTVNLGTTGAGGMDTGAAPASGFVGLYAILNPATGASALLAVNATNSLLPIIYGGANMPAGYTASALVSVWPTNASGQFAVGIQVERDINIATSNALTTSAVQASLTAFSVAAIIPRNAVALRGEYTCSSTVAGAGVSGVISGSALEIGRVAVGATSATASAATTSSFPSIPILNAQTLYYRAAVSSGTLTLLVSITGYTI